ncbi:unnamed protein product [Moneuplotes crassus]|uniref:Uncharacterized protein n=2 Tax=Euplotes crassus TaxID=5936 RepID=A0AAD2D5D5_EUPCR|nr:unnamed protein product [Moneuplotes crassus]
MSEEGEGELILPREDPEHESFVIKEQFVKELWESSRPKSMLIEFYQKLFKPKIFEDEPLDYNKLNILAEFQTYNLLFAKNELLLDDIQCCYILQLFWNLIPIGEDGKRKENAPKTPLPYKTSFDNELIERYQEGIFSLEEIKRISEYSKKFFNNFILYDYVFNNPLLLGTKKNILIPHDKPRIAPNLDKALTLQTADDDTEEEDEGEERF